MTQSPAERQKSFHQRRKERVSRAKKLIEDLIEAEDDADKLRILFELKDLVY